MRRHSSTRSARRHFIGFFLVLALMVSGGLDVMLHAVGLHMPPLLSLVFLGFGATLLQRR